MKTAASPAAFISGVYDMHLILASGSPRRRELLTQIGLTFSVQTAEIDESMDPSKGAELEVARVSRKKAEAVRDKLADRNSLILAADTVVCLDREILGKPKSKEDAKDMLRKLQGRTHLVETGITLLSGDSCLTEVECTEVTFRSLSEEEIEKYVCSGEPMDKAGAYGIQGQAAVFVSGIRGDYFNVVGLPLCRLSQMLKQFEVNEI